MHLKNRGYPIGAEWIEGGTSFRVFASSCSRVDVCLEEESLFYSLESEGSGYFSGYFKEIKKNSLYRFRLDSSEELYPDPASRFQPKGPFGPSQVIDPSGYQWNASGWKGLRIEGQVLYEMHIGTFTKEGTFLAALNELPELAEIGITLLELMPLNEFPGSFGWGYDGVNLFAPAHVYGSPDELRHFIDESHRLGIGVILDVVYNHFGPEGNYINKFSKAYLHETDNEWGREINFDDPNSRLFFLSNARYWIEEFRLDGLRIDATQNIHATTPVHILEEICSVAHSCAKERSVLVIAENEQQSSKHLRPAGKGGYGFDAAWNDDFHHSVLVRLTGRREGYFMDYFGNPQELISCAKHGYLYQGQHYLWHGGPRGTSSLNLELSKFICFIQNHDQIANSIHGRRIFELADPGNAKAATCLLLLGPWTPMLFQGQEFASSSPFLYFADFSPSLSNLVHDGRKKFLKIFPSCCEESILSQLFSPSDPKAFGKSKLDFTERQSHEPIYRLHKDLLRLRKTDSVFSSHPYRLDGAVLGKDALAIRYFGQHSSDRLMLINFGIDLELKPMPEPLLAPPEEMRWQLLFSTEAAEYNGRGIPAFLEGAWTIPGHAAVVLKSLKR